MLKGRRGLPGIDVERQPGPREQINDKVRELDKMLRERHTKVPEFIPEFDGDYRETIREALIEHIDVDHEGKKFNGIVIHEQCDDTTINPEYYNGPTYSLVIAGVIDDRMITISRKDGILAKTRVGGSYNDALDVLDVVFDYLRPVSPETAE